MAATRFALRGLMDAIRFDYDNFQQLGQLFMPVRLRGYPFFRSPMIWRAASLPGPPMTQPPG